MGMTEPNALIMERMLSDDFYLSPYKFVMWAYDWGNGDLREFNGPRQWQKEVMEEIEEYLREATAMRNSLGIVPDYFRYAIASGRGPGKSALVGMLSHWFISTRIGGSVWVAANGAPQLQTKTFPEIAKWVARGINSDFFEVNSMSIQPKKWFREYIESPEGLGRSTRYYYTSGQLWSEENPDAFAGAHNFDGEMAIFDEASGIPPAIWSVQEGVFTENIVDRFWLAFSNPRQDTGAFFECFHRNRDLWRTRQIDSRTVEGISHAPFDNIIKKYGADSDEARVEVYGQFPETSEMGFISRGRVREAMDRELVEDEFAALHMGVDVAREGNDSSVAYFRRGRDARSIPYSQWKGLDNMQLAYRVAELIDKHKPDCVSIDAGNGTGVIDRLREMGYKIDEVWFGSKSDEPEYANRRAMMWGRVKDWLDGGCLPENDQELEDDLVGPMKEFASNGDQIILESKKKMKARGLASPDIGDALALTFNRRVSRKDSPTSRHARKQGNGFIHQNTEAGWLGS